ncbi:cache domain-containing protein [Geosporobacter ferrireducens]|nr:methyl-accepting chemotaxis protein [Geosporobacter ferrireducens]
MKKISMKFIIPLLGISCVLAITTILISYTTVSGIVKEQAAASGIVSAQYNAEIIETWFKEKIASFQRTATHIERLDYFDERMISTMLKDAAEADDSFYSVFIGFEDGSLIDGKGWVPPETYNASLRPWYKAAQEEKGLVITHLYIDQNKKNMVASIAVPIVIQGVNGVLAANIPIDYILGRAGEIIYGKTGYGILADKHGLIISHPSQSYIMHNIADVFGNYEVIHLDKTYRDNIIVETVIIDEIKNLVVRVPIKTCSWELLLIAPLLEFQDPTKQMLKYLMITLGICLLLMIGFGVVIGRSMAKPLERIIAEVAKLANGDLRNNIEIGSKDEFGLLSDELNQMRKNMKAMLQDIQNESILLFRKTGSLLRSIEERHDEQYKSGEGSDVNMMEKDKAGPANTMTKEQIAAKQSYLQETEMEENRTKKIAGTEEVYAIAEQINNIADRLEKGIRSFKI